MSEARDEIRETLRAAAAGGQGPHPEPEELAAYHAGELAGEAERRLQDHLVACRECAALLLDLEGLADPGFGAGRPGAAAERDAAWESFRREIVAAPQPASPVAPVVHGRFDAPSRSSRPIPPRWLYALAATLLLAVGGLSFQVVSLSRQVAELSRPELNSQFLDLGEGTARGAAPSVPAPVARASGRFLNLVLHTPPFPAYGEYRVEIGEAHRERPVWSGTGRPPSSLLPLTVTVPREALGAGDYQIRVFGIDGSRRVKIGDYALQVLP